MVQNLCRVAVGMTASTVETRGLAQQTTSGAAASALNDDTTTMDDRVHQNLWRRTLSILNWMPKRCRYDPKNPPKFTNSMNILLAFATTFTVANLYYPQPILNLIAVEFGVDNERASNVAALTQAGYAVGLAFLCPVADMVPRRPLILLLIVATATVWIGLCLTHDFNVFLALSFICGVGTVTPQLMLPLVGDLAPPERRAACLSIVVSGLSLGMLVARILAGIVSNFTNWRNIYWFALGAQYLTFGILFLTLPDYPTKNKGLNYFKGIWGILVIIVREPLLLQACLIGFSLSAAFTSFWTTLTFLLASPPYGFSSLEIGLFALMGVVVIVVAPIWSRLITDRFVLLFSVVLGLLVDLTGIIIGTCIGRFTIAGPIIQGVFMDSGAIFAHTANRANVYSLDPKARNRINTAYMVFSFAGQLTGTAVGNRLYAEGGWTWSGGCNIAFLGFGLLVTMSRGPRETGWVGWTGGWSIRRDPAPLNRKDESTAVEEAVTHGEASDGSEKPERS